MNCTATAILDASTSSFDTAIGFIAMLISCAAFGTMFIPLKKCECGDGLFVQWIECAVVFLVGVVINAIRGFPQVKWVVAIGGFLYATGNVSSVPIVGGLGMGVGVLIWGTMQTLVGWSVAPFVLPGFLRPTDEAYTWVNNVGLALNILSGGLFVFVRTKMTSSTDVEQATQEDSEEESEVKKELIRKAPYIVMAMILAVLHGLMMSPIDIMKQSSASKGQYKAGMTFWMLAGEKLSQVVALPVATRLLAIIALCDVFTFIEGRRNLVILAVSVSLGVCCVVAIALSNQKF